MPNPHNIKVGDVLWVVFDGHSGRTGTVSKIGKRWGVFSDWKGTRFDLETLRIDGGQCSAYGRVWLSKDACEAEDVRECAWKHFRNQVERYHYPPDDLTTEEIRQMLAILRKARFGLNADLKKEGA
jgi:hypothetical protein